MRGLVGESHGALDPSEVPLSEAYVLKLILFHTPGPDRRRAVVDGIVDDPQANGDGADHAWGGHHFVMGGAVKGGDIYGQYPTFGVDLAGFNNPDAVGGALIPTTSVDQYAATLGAWFGVGLDDLNAIFPNLRNFARPTLGFV